MLKLFLRGGKQIGQAFKKFNFCTSFKDVLIKDENAIEYPTEIVEKYNSFIEKHKESHLQFSDHQFYTQLFYFSQNIPENKGLHSWNIFYEFIKYNYETIDINLLLDAIQQYSRMNYNNFELWYYMEKRILKELKTLSNLELSIVAYSFGYAHQGSGYLYTQLSNEILDRDITSFSRDEFIMIYNGLKNGGIKDKLLWAILDKAKVELYPDIKEI
jgi:hypothetical protein